MMTDEQLRREYNDFLDVEDDAHDLQIVRDLRTAFPAHRPPAALQSRIAALGLDAGNSDRRVARSPRLTWWRRRRVSLAALVIAVAAVGLGTTGLATAAVDAVRTHLFSNPPPSPEAAVWVGAMEIPMWGGCAPHPTTAPISAPSDERIAQLDPVPPGLSSSVSVVFTPCQPAPAPRRAAPTPSTPRYEWETIRVLDVIRYRGTSGTAQLITGQATAEGMRHGLYLGNPAGTLSDGTPAFDLICGGGCAYRHNIRWLRDGLIVSLSGDMTVDQLKALATSVRIE